MNRQWLCTFIFLDHVGDGFPVPYNIRYVFAVIFHEIVGEATCRPRTAANRSMRAANRRPYNVAGNGIFPAGRETRPLQTSGTFLLSFSLIV